MHQSFGSNEEITQRRDNKIQRLRQIDNDLMSLHQQREQVSKVLVMGEGGGSVEKMHQSFGSNEEITQRRDKKVQRLRQIDDDLMSLHQQREQVSCAI